MAPSAAPDRKVALERHTALLGGTTTTEDCIVVLRYLSDPRRLVCGPSIALFERVFADTIGVRYAFSFASGRVALYGVLGALEIGRGAEVLLQVPTHIVVANAIRYTGARPVYVDCRRDTYTIDLEQAEQRVTRQTRALVIQHTFGIPANLDEAVAFADRHGLELIEDCVHSLGATYDGRQLGSFGRAAFFSTEETKTISSTMGGILVTDDPQLAAALARFQDRCEWPPRALTARYMLKLLAYHMLTEPHVHRYARAAYDTVGRRNPLPSATTAEERQGARPPGYECRLSNAQAALAHRQLERLAANVAHRQATARAYEERLRSSGVDLPKAPAKGRPAFVRYPVWVPDRRATLARLASRVTLGTWFTSVLEEADSPQVGGYVSGSCPVAEEAARHLVNLPTHPRVTEADVAEITTRLAAGIE